MSGKEYVYHDDEAPLVGYVSGNQGNDKPAVLVFPDWTGRNTFADQQTDQLAEQGYVGFAVDIYGNGIQGKTVEEKSALISPFMEDREKLLKRIKAAFDTVSQLPSVSKNKIAAIGFCFGGLCALDLARSGASIQGAVAFHALFTPPKKTAQSISAKILALHGFDDPMATPQQMKDFADEMTTAKADWQIHVYGNTAHAFTNPLANDVKLGTVYSEVAAKRAMQATHNFLQEIFNSQP